MSRLLPRAIGFILAVVACAICTGLSFLAMLSLWGIFLAPFVHLHSSSFVIVCALALSTLISVMAYGAFIRCRLGQSFIRRFSMSRRGVWK
ncbi:MAG: hypothetical protein RBT62_01380 [Spirochaetia bacterium]|nr:hypothetical protein [Spirochaetia bacterium]